MHMTTAEPQSASSMSLALVNRRDGTVLSSEPVEDSKNPLLLPPPDTTIWHYVRFHFFQALLRNRALWLTRLDQQSDKYDGMYSEANAREQTIVLRKLMERSGFKIQEGKHDWENLQWTNQVLRERTFVHCWSIRAEEAAWMWNSFVRDDPRSIAVRTTVGSLLNALRGQPVDFFRMLYYSTEEPRPDWSYTAPFSAKDRSAHASERELRVWTMTDRDKADGANHKLIPINLKLLIRKVVVHPACPPNFHTEVRNELKVHGIPAHVAKSQLRLCDLQAVKSHS